MSNWYFKLFEVSFALSIVKIEKLIFSAFVGIKTKRLENSS